MTRPSVRLAHLPTPLEPMHRLTDALGGPRILVKRDDCTGLALGGNKARKLEYLCTEAFAAGCDVLVTGGGPQSNHVRMTAAAANRLGLGCEVVLAGGAPGDLAGGNLLLDQMFGAVLHFLERDGYDDLEAGILALAERLQRDGRSPFAIPVGGASVTGAVAYADAADELAAQVVEHLDGTPPEWLVVADGSGGTHAGLLAGLDRATRVLGIDAGTRPDLEGAVHDLATATAASTSRPAPPASVLIDHDRFGTGYGHVTDAAVEAMRLTARLEGIVLDPVYTGKAMAGLIAAVREGRIGADETVVFWHTGGAPALFAHHYADVFTGP